jgi:tRNA pseudouridine32 synthase/23S rRNA pseudouridine746 synthase
MNQPAHFLRFKSPIEHIGLPEKFTFPFYYEPHPLAVLAAEQLQEYLLTQEDFIHNFGIDPNDDSLIIGKMFGVLVVKNSVGEIGFLAAFSGKLAESNHHKMFVPPVFDMLYENSFFTQDSEVVNIINRKIEAIEANQDYIHCKESYASLMSQSQQELSEKKQWLNDAKRERKAKRKSAQDELSPSDFEELTEALKKESLRNQFYYRELSEHWKDKLTAAKSALDKFEDELKSLKTERKEKSNQLQRKLFEQYTFLNQNQENKSLYQIFNEGMRLTPPAGAGECAAPKLLQYAFGNNLTPIALAEFWWGVPPKSEVRKHAHYYPACRGKCEPILKHMLEGITLDDNPMEKNFAKDKVITTLYEDDYFLAINKPPELLSVPGINVQDSVFTRMQFKYPEATGPLIIHRLDMNTSGIMLIAKTKEVHKLIQGQFIKRKVQKEYIAILEGIVQEDQGKISLPLRVDLEDRPRQLVCYEHGKKAETKWEVISRSDTTTRIKFHPITGRTHQLRVHAAHPKGLNSAILGDDLYGNKDTRLHLHASKISFSHPISREPITIESPAEF